MRPVCFAALLLALLPAACSEAPASRFASTVGIVGDAVPEPLEGKQGDLQRGQEVFTSRDSGHCLLCHQLASLDSEFQGNVGPPLTGIGTRLTAGQIRYRIIDAQNIWPDTVMPSYYRTDGLRQVGEAYQGAPALDAQKIEDLVAFLETQTD